MPLNLNEDSEFRDQLIARGIIDDPNPPRPPTPDLPSDADLLHASLSLANTNTLQKLEDEAPDSDDERMFQSYRLQRLKELKKEERKARFGDMRPMGRADYTREVTEASAIDEDEEGGKGLGTGVVCFLYKDGQPASVSLSKVLDALAKKHPRTKFLKIIGSQCIENYPDKNLPTLLVYRGGKAVRQVVAGSLGIANERDIEQLLLSSSAILPSHMPISGSSRNDDDDDNEASSDEEWGGLPKHRTNNKPVNGAIRSSAKAARVDSEDEDFDL